MPSHLGLVWAASNPYAKLEHMKLAPLALLLALSSTSLAQQTFTDPANLRGERVKPRDGRELPIDTGTLGLQQLLRKLSTRASILNIVAHPDDEDGGMLTLYARGLGARVADLSLTRGEGGQNAMTGDFEDALGLLRTQELLANDRYTGVDQMFGTEVDFGFSKTKEEAFAKWTHDRVLYDAVRAIRLFRPLVITATFIGGVTDGHGQHQVSGQIAQEAFKAAGDPTVFPDMIAEGILPWQPLKVYARVPSQSITPQGLYDYATNQFTPARFTNYVTGEVTTTPPSRDIIVHEGTPDPLLTTAAANPADLSPTLASQTTPLTYIQFARIGLGLQKSQIGPGVRNAPTGAFDVAYHLYGSCLNPSSDPPKICHPERSLAAPSQGAVEGPATKPVSAHSSDLSNPNLLLTAPNFFRDIDPDANASANGAPHTSLGQSPRFAAAPETRGLKDRLITASLTTNPSAGGAPYTSVGRSPTKPRTKDPQGPEARPIAASEDPNFFTGIDTSLESIAIYAPEAFPAGSLATITHSIQRATTQFNPNHPDTIAPTLVTALTDLDQLITHIEHWEGDPTAKANALHELRIKRVQLNDALALSLNLNVSGTILADGKTWWVDSPSARPDVDILGQRLMVRIKATAPNTQSLRALKLDINTASGTNVHQDILIVDGDDLPGIPFSPQGEYSKFLSLELKNGTAPTRPYFQRTSIEQPYYDLSDKSFRNAPASSPALTSWETFQYLGIEVNLGAVVRSGPQPVNFVPALNVSLSNHAQILSSSANSFAVSVTATPPEKIIAVSASLTGENGGDGTTNAKPDHGYLPATSKIELPFNSKETQTVQASALSIDGRSYSEGYRAIGYGDLPRTNYYTPATTRIVPVDLNLPTHHKLAYLPGTGDAVPAALASINLTPTLLTVADLTPTNLAQYDTVILGVRTYSAHPDLHGAPTQALLDYARNGGNVVVQYQTLEFTAEDAPYPLSLGSNEKVVDETAPVQLLTPSSSGPLTLGPGPWILLTTPNRITPADFNSWISERGHGFLSTWDTHYTALTETHDPGQAPQRGGLITTPLGKGSWTYVAFALYRQLPEAVPGAYRLFLNLLNP
jgi:LmbE family N-acetylglucosaminyl deacetylase